MIGCTAVKDLSVQFWTRDSAATSIEYAMIAAGIALVIIATVQGLGSSVKASYVSVYTSLK